MGAKGDGKASTPCKFFAKGACEKGSACPYSHRGGKDSGKGGKGKDYGKGFKGEFNHELDLEETDEEFGFRQKLIGDGGQNVKYIEEQCEARVSITHRQPLKVAIRAEAKWQMDKAVKMFQELVRTVWDEYQRYSAPRRSSTGKGKGGGKDDGKDRSSTPCKFFAKGACDRGSSCPYLHESHSEYREYREKGASAKGSGKDKSSIPCKFFGKGTCEKGSACPYL